MSNRLLAAVARRGVRAALRPAYRRFERGLERPAAAQLALLELLTRDLATTEYGRSLGVRGREPYGEFVRKVPIVAYEDLQPWIDRQAATSQAILTSGPIVVFEETSGSSGPRKLIPYNRRLLASFDRLFRIWTYDLLTLGPGFRTGKTFLSVSPAVRERRRTPAGVPVGFDDDTSYLSGLARRLVGSRFLYTRDLHRVRDVSVCRRVIAARLLAERDLEIISIWSPTYLGSLLDFVESHRAALRRDLERGCVEVNSLRFPVRSREDIGATLDGLGPVDWSRVWPRLQLLSCWTDATAGLFVDRLRRRFPGVR
ncbi:MAG: GH3 auxin-responsive promoter family protein, partial [Gemmatimonadales bacterium]